MVQSPVVTQFVMRIQSLMMIHSLLIHLTLKPSLTLCVLLSLGLLHVMMEAEESMYLFDNWNSV